MRLARLLSFCFAATTLLLFSAAALAQNHPNVTRGFGVNKVFELASDLETVDTFNGGLTLRIPIGQSYPLNAGLSYGLTLTYTSKLWDHEQVFDPDVQHKVAQLSPGAGFNAGLGWTLSMGRLLKPNAIGNPSPDWVYVDPDGGYVTMTDRLHQDGSRAEFYYYSEARGPLRLYAPHQGQPKLEFPDGTVHEFDSFGRLVRIEDPHGNFVTVLYSPTKWTIQDQHLRQTVVSFGAVGSELAGQVTLVKLPAFNGTSAFYRFQYAAQRVRISAACPNSIEPYFYDVPVLEEVVLPDGSSYAMPKDSSYFLPYQPTVGCVSDPGLLTGLELPSRGRLEYDWGDWEFPSKTGPGECLEYHNITPGIIERRRFQVDKLTGQFVLDGRWTYDQELHFDNPGTIMTNQCYGDTLVPPKRATVEVTDPLGHRTVTHFSVAFKDGNGYQAEEYGLPVNRKQSSGGRFLSRQIFNGSAANPLRSVYANYAAFSNGVAGAGAALWARPLEGQRTVFHDDGDRWVDVASSSWDGLGHWRTTTVSSNFPGNIGGTTTPARNSTTQYNPGSGPSSTPKTSDPWVLGNFTERTLTEAGVMARETFCFEAATGQLLRRRVHSGPSWASNDLVELFTYDGNGNRIRNRSFGGDLQPISTGSSLCNLALPQAVPVYDETHTYKQGVQATSQYTGLTFKTADRDIDDNIGLPSAERDTSGLATTYRYDALGRVDRITPPGEVSAQITYYPGAHRVLDAQGQVVNPGTSPFAIVKRGSLTQSNVYFDDFGRVASEDAKMPDRSGGAGTYSTRRRTQYDGAGNVSQTSTWTEPGTSEGAPWTRRRQIDPFGRPGKILAPDDSTTLLRYRGVREMDREVSIGIAHGPATPNPGNHDGALLQNQSITTEVYDGHGRLIAVQDPSQPSGATASTFYDYDVGNRLVKVTQGGQIRQFTYDQRGLLLSETHPELGATGKGTVTYSRYDARGHAGRKQDGRVDLSFLYDPAERLSEVKETTGLARTLKSFSYWGQSTGGDWRAGKLHEARRINYVVNPAAPGTPELAVEVIESFEYKTPSGRVSKRTTQPVLFNLPTFQMSYSYDSLGNVASIQYPRCDPAGQGFCPTVPARTVTLQYSQGLLAAIPGYMNSLTYHSNGMIHELAHSNGVVDQHDRDADGMRRPARIRNTIISEHLAGGIPAGQEAITQNGLGPYEYDGAGNITRVGCGTNFYCRQYHYDKASRIREDWNPANLQRYTYDRYGNLSTIQTAFPGSSGTQTLSPVAATNRLGGTAYDASGNQLQWGLEAAYTWDPFNNLKTFTDDNNQRTFLYTADDERVWVSNFTTNPNPVDTWTFYLRGLDNKVLTVYEVTDNSSSAGWKILKDYIYRDGQLLAAFDYEANRRYHFTLDHLGTPRLVSNNVDSSFELLGYFAYGDPDSPPPTSPLTGPATERMKYTGHERDLNNDYGRTDDLDYMHARYFNPNLGRFLSVDALRLTEAQKNTRRWNRYNYAISNPIAVIDPTGLKDQRSSDDIAILEDSDVLSAVAEIVELTRLDLPLEKRQEAGALVTLEGGNDFGVDGRVRADGSLTAVAQPYKLYDGGTINGMNGDPLAAALHSHPGSGIVTKGADVFRLQGNTSSPADRIQAQTLGVPVYIINADKSLLRVLFANGKTSTMPILTKKDFTDYLARAQAQRFSDALQTFRIGL